MSRRDKWNRRDFLKVAGCAASLAPLTSAGALVSDDARSVSRECPLLGKGASVGITPGEGWRDKAGDYRITLTLGKEGLPAKDSIGILHGSFLDRWQFTFPSHFWHKRSPWQSVDGNLPNFLAATCSRAGVTLNLKVGQPLGKGHPNGPSDFVNALAKRMRCVLEISASEGLRESDVIEIAWKNVHAPSYAMRYHFMAFRFSKLPALDRDLPIRRGEYDDLPSIRIKGHGATSLYVTCRPMQGAGEKFSLNIAAIDEYGNPAEDFEGDVQLRADESLHLPKSVRFGPDDRGCKRTEGVQGSKPGWFRIAAKQGSVSGVSNYVVISEEKPSAGLYFGDMHNHTLDCDGTNDIHEHFHYAPNVAGMDFGAVSCHAEYFGCKAAWDRYLKETAKANRPGEFITFPGYEWAQQGHTNAYFLSEKDAVLIWGEKRMKAIGNPPDSPKFRVGAASEKEYMQLLKKLKQPAFTIAHVHTAYKDIDDSVHYLDEIYSCHLHNRTKRENRLRGNLARGLRLGVVAGSDMHRLTMGHLCKTPGKRWPQGGWENCQYQTAGLQATYADELTRAGLHQGMKDRYTYGTSGARIVLLFHCGDAPMGSQIKMKAGEVPEFKIEVGGTGTLSEIALCRYDGKKWSEPFKKSLRGTDRCSASWRDKDFSGSGIYYVRVTQSDGEQAWSSPIWIARS
jgi:hypothetical protein